MSFLSPLLICADLINVWIGECNTAGKCQEVWLLIFLLVWDQIRERGGMLVLNVLQFSLLIIQLKIAKGQSEKRQQLCKMHNV